MLLRLIKSNNFFGTLFILILGVLFWMQSFQSPQNLGVVAMDRVMPLYFYVFGLLSGLHFWQVLTGFILVMINSLLIARLSSSFLLFKKGSSLPGIIYVITIASVKMLQTIHPVHFATLCVLIAIYYIFDTYQKRLEITFTFNAAFFIALASLFYLPSVVLFPLVWISIFVLQKSDNWRLLVVPILGFGVPWIFIWAILFIKDTNEKLPSTITNILWTENNAYLMDPIFLSLSGLIMLLTAIGSISLLSGYQLIKVSSRKFFTIFYWMLGLLVITALSLSSIGIEIVALSTVPVAFLISHFLLSGKRYFWKELIFLIYLGVMIAISIM